MKILYTIAGLYRPAGMERILTSKANYLCEHGYEVIIVTTEQKNRPLAFPLNEAIRCIDLGIGYEDNNGASAWNKIIHYPGKQKRHKKALRKLLFQIRPDITISMFCGDESFLPSIKDGSKKILEVHFSRYKRLQYGRKGLWAYIDRYRSRQESSIVARFDRFVTLTHEDYNNWGAPKNAIVIPNFLENLPYSPSNLTGKVVVAVGRFTYQKAFNRLIDIWYIVNKQLGSGHGWRLRLVGDGEMKTELQQQINDLNLVDSAEISEPQKDMGSVYNKVSVLAMTSRYEGLPMVLLEAQSFGIPIVSFDCKCGPRDVITDGEDGLLVPEGDIASFAEALIKLIQDEELRIRMGINARKNSDRWNRSAIMPRWTALFRELYDGSMNASKVHQERKNIANF